MHIEIFRLLGAKGIKLDYYKYPSTDILVDVQTLPFKDKTFDIVICLEVIEHVKDPFKAVKELCRISKKFVFFSTPCRKGQSSFADPTHIHHWDKKDFKKCFLENKEFGWKVRGIGVRQFAENLPALEYLIQPILGSVSPYLTGDGLLCIGRRLQ